MGAILTGAHDPIHFLGGGIVPAEYLVRFGCEVEFAAHVIQAVRSVQHAQVDDAQRLLRYEIDDRDGIVSAEAVVGNVGEFAIRGSGHLVGVGPGWHARHHLQGGRIDYGESVVLLG